MCTTSKLTFLHSYDIVKAHLVLSGMSFGTADSRPTSASKFLAQKNFDTNFNLDLGSISTHAVFCFTGISYVRETSGGKGWDGRLVFSIAMIMMGLEFGGIGN